MQPSNLLLSYYSETNQGKVSVDPIHTKTTQNWIEVNGKELSGRVLFLGAGSLEFAPAKELSKTFKDVVISSIDQTLLDAAKQQIKGVKTVQCDLSGGLCEAINKLAGEIKKDDTDEFIAGKVSVFIEGFIPDISSLTKTLGTADYIVSSNVGSQISTSALNFLEVHFKSITGKDLKIKDADKSKLKEKMIVHHYALLKSLQGKICYIDTFSVHGQSKADSSKRSDVQLISKRAEDILAKTFKETGKGKWEWVVEENDKLKKWYDVYAFILDSSEEFKGS